MGSDSLGAALRTLRKREDANRHPRNALRNCYETGKMNGNCIVTCGSSFSGALPLGESIYKTGAKRLALVRFLLLGLHTSRAGQTDMQKEMSADHDSGTAMEKVPEHDSIHAQGPLAEPKRADVSAPAQAPGRSSFSNSIKLQQGIEGLQSIMLIP